MIWEALTEYLLGFRNLYPEIDTWLSKLYTELPSGRRTIWVVSNHGCIDGLAIVKNGRRAKLCHFSIAEAARDKGIARELLRAAFDAAVVAGAYTLHVTTSEETAEVYGDFFQGCGFVQESWSLGRYRPGVDEIRWSATCDALRPWLSATKSSVLSRCNGESTQNDIEVPWTIRRLNSVPNTAPWPVFRSGDHNEIGLRGCLSLVETGNELVSGTKKSMKVSPLVSPWADICWDFLGRYGTPGLSADARLK